MLYGGDVGGRQQQSAGVLTSARPDLSVQEVVSIRQGGEVNERQ